jgi:hypothetical protein
MLILHVIEIFKMKLYEVPRNSKIRVLDDIATPPCSTDISEQEVLIFNKIDGMYSHCHNSKGDVVHLAAWSEVEIIDETV